MSGLTSAHLPESVLGTLQLALYYLCYDLTYLETVLPSSHNIETSRYYIVSIVATKNAASWASSMAVPFATVAPSAG